MLEIETVIADTGGKFEYSQGFPYNIRINDKDLGHVRSDGLAIHIYTPIKNPGDYYVRAAVRDRVSGKIGSGYQFLGIPDLKKNRLSLSSIFVLNPRENASFIKTGNFKGSSDASKVQVWHSLRESFPLLKFRPGDCFEYAVVVNRSKYDEKQIPQLFIQSAIFKDGKEISRTNLERLDLGEMADYRRIPVVRKLSLDSNMEPGAYILQLTVFERQKANKSRIAAQAINFQIRKE